MDNVHFTQMIVDLGEAKKFRAGKKAKVRISRVAFEPVKMAAPEIRKVRATLGFSHQSSLSFFTPVLGPSVVGAGTRRPTNAALRLLAIAKKKPALFLEAQ